MAVTYTRVGTNYENVVHDYAEPAGTGGIIVVLCLGKDTSWEPVVPGDWNIIDAALSPGDGGYSTEINGAYWALASSTPNPGFDMMTSGEGGLYAFRISDADVASPEIRLAEHQFLNSTATVHDMPDVTSIAGATGAGIVITTSASATPTSSIGMTSQYHGPLGDAGWWATTASALTIDDATVVSGGWDSGTLTTATAPGSVYSTISIFVKTSAGGATVPDAPTAVSGTNGDASSVVTWTPGADGGSAITNYDVDWALASAPTTWLGPVATGSTSATYTKTGLTNGTGYVFRVRAVNAIGAGTWSSSSATVTPTAPATGFRLTMAGDKTLTMTGSRVTLMAGAPAATAHVMKRWNGTAWVPVVMKHGAGWPTVSLGAL